MGLTKQGRPTRTKITWTS